MGGIEIWWKGVYWGEGCLGGGGGMSKFFAGGGDFHPFQQ